MYVQKKHVYVYNHYLYTGTYKKTCIRVQFPFIYTQQLCIFIYVQQPYVHAQYLCIRVQLTSKHVQLLRVYTQQLCLYVQQICICTENCVHMYICTTAMSIFATVICMCISHTRLANQNYMYRWLQ